MELPFLANQRLTDEQIKKIVSLGDDRDPVRYAVIGKLSPRGDYGKVALLVTAAHLFTYDFDADAASDRIAFSDIDTIEARRMYGNGVLRLRLKTGGSCDLFRFTFAAAVLCDGVCRYVTEMRDGVPEKEARDTLESIFEKTLSVCPKCGRTLPAPGATCLHCMKKGRLLRKMGGYLKPEAPVLIVSVLISVLTTTLALQEAVEALPKGEGNLIRLRYFHNLTQSQTARLLGMTQVKVSREEKRILKKMREEFFSAS